MSAQPRVLSVLPACLFTLTLASWPLSSSAAAQTAPGPNTSHVAPLAGTLGSNLIAPMASSQEPTLQAAPSTMLALNFAALPTPLGSSPAAASSSIPEEAQPVTLVAPIAGDPPPPAPNPDRGTRPFSALAVGVKIGIAGIGFDVATPLAQRFNLRFGSSFFSYNSNFNEDGTTIAGDLKLRSVNMSVDWFPFNNRFRISPGVILYNGNSLNAAASVPGGQTFSLGDAEYTSSTADPVHGSAALIFGKRTAPSLTVGTGNMIPRHGGHISVPFEIGFEYITSPTFTLALAGTACSQGVCQSTSNPQFQSNLVSEQQEINSDIAPLRIYPIVSLGVAYKF